jgi:hypothetical protein
MADGSLDIEAFLIIQVREPTTSFVSAQWEKEARAKTRLHPQDFLCSGRPLVIRSSP